MRRNSPPTDDNIELECFLQFNGMLALKLSSLQSYMFYFVLYMVFVTRLKIVFLMTSMVILK